MGLSLSPIPNETLVGIRRWVLHSLIGFRSLQGLSRKHPASSYGKQRHLQLNVFFLVSPHIYSHIKNALVGGLCFVSTRLVTPQRMRSALPGRVLSI